MKQDKDNTDNDADWEYGDIWMQGKHEEPNVQNDIAYVEILRGDTGRGFDDSVMLDLVAYLGSFGIHATFDSFSLGLEPAAIKTYVLKVESGKEDEAMTCLKKKFNT